MPDPNIFDLISSAVSSIKSINDLVAGDNKNDVRKIIDSATNELTSIREHVVTLREQCSTLDQKKMELEKQLSKLVDLDNYKLAKTKIGGTAYQLKSPGSDVEADTYFCVNCINNGQQSILQPHPFRGDRAIGARKVDFICFTCNSEC